MTPPGAQPGYTLIEAMVVVAILGIFCAAAVPTASRILDAGGPGHEATQTQLAIAEARWALEVERLDPRPGLHTLNHRDRPPGMNVEVETHVHVSGLVLIYCTVSWQHGSDRRDVRLATVAFDHVADRGGTP